MLRSNYCRSKAAWANYGGAWQHVMISRRKVISSQAQVGWGAATMSRLTKSQVVTPQA